MVGKSVLAAVGVLLAGAGPAAAAPELTLTATHAKATFLRSAPPNTTPYSGTLALTVRLDTLDTGIALRNKHMKETYLETDKFPEARLEVARAALRVPGKERWVMVSARSQPIYTNDGLFGF